MNMASNSKPKLGLRRLLALMTCFAISFTCLNLADKFASTLFDALALVGLLAAMLRPFTILIDNL